MSADFFEFETSTYCVIPVLMYAKQRLATSGLDVYAHNIETVRRLQPYVRDKRAGYEQSLSVLKRAKAAGQEGGVYTKTSLMLGLGETEDEVLQVIFLGNWRIRDPYPSVN